MYLKRIELENFKSFMGELTIDLQQGFTAITGPNGSGKSNSGDAIQFVLGTRSTKSLRAQNVKELIFNGGGRAKPARHCKVTLTFANPVNEKGSRRLKVDGDEVRFTRAVRLNSKGKAVSDYRLNDAPSSSTEFRRLLIEAGARGDGYNIVLQGDVTNLASMSALERRRVLEDVAGVTQYDDELKKAERQRKQVESQLEMIEVFEAEQTRRVESLEKEREDALKYRTLMEELQTSRSLLMQAKHRSNFEEIRMLGDERTRYIDSSEELKDQCERSELRIQELDDEIVRLQKEMEALLGSDQRGTMERIRKLELQIDRASDRISELESTSEKALIEAKSLSKEIKRARDAVESNMKVIDDATTALKRAKATMAAAKSEESDARKAMEQGDRATMDLNRAYGKASEEATRLADSLQVSILEMERARQAADISHGRLADLQESLQDAEMEVNDLEMTLEEMDVVDSAEERTRLGEELRRLENQQTTLQGEEGRARANRNEAERSLVRAQQQMESRSGRSSNQAQAVAAICAIRDSGGIQGILGPLNELCCPKDEAHALALSYALGGGMNHIVVETDEVATQCIRRLKADRLGRAVFLPLNKMQVRRAGGRSLMVSRQPGIVGFAADLLEFDESIENAVRNAVRDTLIVQNMEVARKNMGGVRMVTVDGSVFEASGAMVGGASKSPQATFGGGKTPGLSAVEKAQVALSEAELVLMTVTSALEENRLSQKTIRDKMSQVSDIDGSLRVREVRSDLQRAQNLQKDLINQVKAAEKDLAHQSKSLEKVESSASAAEAARDAAVDERDRLLEQLRSQTPEHLAKRLRDAETQYTESSRESLTLESTLTTSRERLSMMEEEVDKLEARKKESEETSTDSLSEIDQIRTDRIIWVDELDELKEEHSQVSEEHRELDELRTSHLEERATLKARVDTMGSKRVTVMTRITELNAEIDRKHIALKELIDEMTENEISIPEEHEVIPAFTEIETKVRNLERRVSNMGSVNLLAIEQYDEAASRVAQLQADAKALRDRREKLLAIANKLETERRTRLTDVLDRVSANFSRVYRILQPGGAGDLRLENPDDPFSGGLQMWAKPPGKSNQIELHLLSGGEKSMAALALIFAIQDFEPSPFYYFDEVDQNLDSFNAESIAQLCRLRSERAQFLMVTLRKVSLQLADHHIGVTHGGDGCSRLIMNFDRDAAVELGEAAEREREAQEAAKAEMEGLEELPKLEDRPRVPEPLPTPESLGGIREDEGEVETLEIEESVKESQAASIAHLGDRAADTKEDLDERLEWESRLEESIASESEPPKSEIIDESEIEE